MQTDDAGKIAGVFLRQRRGSHRTAGGKGLFCQQAHVFLSHGHPGVVQQQLLFFAQLLLVQPGLPHRGQRRFAAGRGGRVEGLCPEHRRRVKVQALCHRAVIRREQLIGRFDLLGIAAEQRRDAALGRAVAQQQELRPLDGPLAVADVAGVDLPDEGAHLFQRIPQLLDEGTHGRGGFAGGTALHPGVIQRQPGQVFCLAVVQLLLQIGTVVEQVIAGLEAVVSGGHHLFLVLVEELQHLLRGAVAGEPVDIMPDGCVQRPQGLVQCFQIRGHLPQNILIGALFLPDVLQQLPCLVQLAGVGDNARVQDLFQRFQQGGHLRHKGKGRLLLIAAGLLFQPAGAAQAEQKAQRKGMGIPGGLFGFVARVIGIQCQRLCQCRKVILGPAHRFCPGDGVIRRVAALFPQQEQQLRIKRPVGPRQRAEQPRADQFKQLHPKVPFFR